MNAKAERRRWLGAMRYNITILTQIPFVCRRPRNPCTLTIDGEARELDLFLAAIMCNKFVRCPRIERRTFTDRSLAYTLPLVALLI